MPMRLEWGFLPGNILRNENFVISAGAGGCVTVVNGAVQAENERGEVLSLSPTFAEHNVQNRMGGAYPQSSEHFTVYFAAYTPFEKVIHIGTEPVFGKKL